MRRTGPVPPLVLSLVLLGASSCQPAGQQQTAADSAALRSAASESESSLQASDRPSRAQERASVERALELYVEGMIEGDADRIPLASDVMFVEPDGSTESTLRGISEVAPFLERQPIDDIEVHQTLVNGEYGCELTDYYWSDGPKMPIALCLRVVKGKITEIRPYFDRSLFDD